LTPAGIAQQIRALEKDIGTALVFRSGRTVRPTRAAAAMLRRARNVINEVRDLRSLANSAEFAGELRLGAVQTTLSGIVPDVLSAMAKTYSQIQIRIIRDGSEQLYQKVVSGEIDAAMTSEPPFAIPKNLAWHTLREEPFVVLAPASLRTRDPHAILAQ